MRRSEETRVAVAAIAEAREAFVGALRDGDAAAASAVYTEDARLLPPTSEPLQGREAIEAFWKAGVDSGISEVELDALELEGDGGFAYEIGRYALRLNPTDGGTVVDRGRYLLVHERRPDGSWGRAVEMFSPDALPARTDGRRAERRRR